SNFITDRINIWRLHMKDDSYGEEIFRTAVFNTYKQNNVYHLVDKNTKYVKVKDGHRIVPNEPKQYQNIIYTFGNSLCMGMYTDDEHTIQYQLQKRMNEYALINPERESLYNSYKVINAGNGGHPNYFKMWKSIEYHRPKEGDIIVLISWFESMIESNPEYLKHFDFCFPQRELRLFDRPHNYGDYVWVDRVHFNCKTYTKIGDCLADKIITICEKNDGREDVFSVDDWDVVPPDKKSLTKSKYWNYQHFKSRNFIEFIRKCPLQKEKNNTVRWLNFLIKRPLDAGKKYKITIELQCEEDITFKLFFHGGGKIDYLPIKSVEAGKWTTVIYEYEALNNNIQYMSLSASNFISSGQKLYIKNISIREMSRLDSR
ncbi:MAG TPA: hypothetical protein H9909_10320, partial [Candidatus Mediterraneibacter norfolkensis]|nr:hypothetical protein [Candidatus Mediterraneibacter norfolkensis]